MNLIQSSFPEAKWIVDNVIQNVGQCPNNMRTFIVSGYIENSLKLWFLEPEDSHLNERAICTIAGVMIRMSTEGYPTSPVEGTLVIDNKELGRYQTEPLILSNLEEGKTYYFSAFPYSTLGVYNLANNPANRQQSGLVGTRTYGISRDITSSPPAWTRTDDAIDYKAKASVGETVGSSDFDKYYPWSEIKRETFDSGDVMVKIPKFWFKRYREDNIEYIKIASGPVEGFELHPAFNHADIEQEDIYVGAYKCNSSWKSVSGSSPAYNSTGYDLPSSRTKIQAKGAGWSLLDISTWSAIQMLILVEFATNSVQTAIGQDISAASSSQRQGSCDSVPNLTGRPAGTNNLVASVWRGIESLWGNLGQWVDGLYCVDTRYAICNDPSKYTNSGSSTDYTTLSYKSAESAGGYVGGYVTQIGYDINNPAIMLPVDGSSLGSATTYYCDYAWVRYSSATSGTGVGAYGYNGDTKNGLFHVYTANGSIWNYYGSRMIYIPTLAEEGA